MVLHPDFREFLRALSSRRVRFLVVGAHAVAAHGRPRLTGDLDVLIEPTVANASRVLAALADFGFGGVGLSVADFARADRVVQLGVPPVRIDLLTSISAVRFGTAWRNRLTTRLDGLRVPVLGLRELRRNKRAAGRAKDVADLALLAELDGSRRR